MNVDAVPTWGLFVGTIVIVVFAIDSGYRLGRMAHRRSEDEKESPVSGVAAAAVGVLAFTLAFTFDIEWERHDAREDLVRQEANAVRTACHRTDFLPENDRVACRRLHSEHADRRVEFAQGTSIDPARVGEFLASATRMQDSLWDMAVTNARNDMKSDVAALYIESLNQVTELYALRIDVRCAVEGPLGSGAPLTASRCWEC